MHFFTDSIYIISTDITNLNRCPNNKHNKSCHFHSIELSPKYCPKVPDSKLDMSDRSTKPIDMFDFQGSAQ